MGTGNVAVANRRQAPAIFDNLQSTRGRRIRTYTIVRAFNIRETIRRNAGKETLPAMLRPENDNIMSIKECDLWFAVRVTMAGEPTEQDPVGCDGLYAKDSESFQLEGDPRETIKLLDRIYRSGIFFSDSAIHMDIESILKIESGG